MNNDIVAVLRADHALLHRLANELRACATQAAAQHTFNHFAAALGGHLTAVRKAVYPGLKSVGWKDVSSTLLVCHSKLNHAFADLLTLKRGSAAFSDALSDLVDAVESLIGLERSDLLPLLDEHLDTAQQLTIGLDAQAYMAHELAPLPLAQRLSAAERLEEARLLLGGAQALPRP